MAPSRLFWRALLAFLVLPGTIAFLAPYLIRPAGARFHAAGLPPLVVGVALLLWCVPERCMIARPGRRPLRRFSRSYFIGRAAAQ